MNKFLALIAGTVFLVSCGNSGSNTTGEDKTEVNVVETPPADLCTYNYNDETTSVFWKAYKQSAKIAVNGRFETFDVNGAKTSSSPEKLMEGLIMSVDVMSINSNDTLRDGKLRRSFFGIMQNTSMIKGEIIAVNGSTGTLKMTMNDVEKEIPFDLAISDTEVELRATIDILSFSADKAFETLGEACAEKHTGGDGVRKFWSEVDIYIKTTLDKACKE